MQARNKAYNKASLEQQHTERIRRLFNGIASRYDSINRQQSFMLDVGWRRRAVAGMSFFKTMRFLDVATGTADLAIEVLMKHTEASAVGVDVSDELLDIGRKKIEASGLSGRMEIRQGNALDLEFDDGSFDVAGIAFGIRNIKDRLHALEEMVRVVVAGGQVVVLELSFEGASPLIKPFYCAYMKAVIPFMARFVSRDSGAYEYLGRSIIEFPPPGEFCSLMEKAGLVDVRSVPLTFGVARLFSGVKPLS